jgi:hypothetical protein
MKRLAAAYWRAAPHFVQEGSPATTMRKGPAPSTGVTSTVARLAVAVLVIATVGGCVLAGGASTVALAYTITVESRTVFVSGQTDLPEGAHLSVQMAPPSESLQVMVVSAYVETSSFSAHLHVPDGWLDDEVNVTIAFDPTDGQPDAVVTRFGEDGRGLSGPNVHESSDGVRLVVKQTVRTGP